eukprot:jgi/Tetstr1/425058/TSEL_015522.t1
MDPRFTFCDLACFSDHEVLRESAEKYRQSAVDFTTNTASTLELASHDVRQHISAKAAGGGQRGADSELGAGGSGQNYMCCIFRFVAIGCQGSSTGSIVAPPFRRGWRTRSG